MAAANEHGNRADYANDESCCADHGEDQIQGVDSGTLYQILERAGGRRVLDDRIGNDVQDDEENKAKDRRQEEEHKLPCPSPWVSKRKDKGNRCEQG